MIGYYNYTVILTYLGLASAVTGMVQALSGNCKAAVLFLLFCGFCDMFDGTVARTKERTPDEISFGAHIDSLCDVICFGAFPAVLGYSFGICGNIFGVIAMVLYVLAGVIRLAYFDVQELSRLQNDEGLREYYTGLPITSAALIIPGIVILMSLAGVSVTVYYAAVLVVMAFLFVSKLQIKKPYGKGLIVLAVLGTAVAVLVMLFGDRIG